MARFKNGFGEERVVPSLGYVLVADGAEINVPDNDAHHWTAGGWVRLDAASEPVAAPVARPVPAAVPSEDAK